MALRNQWNRLITSKLIVRCHALHSTLTKMPASSIDLYHMQDARNNFDAMRPAPICAEANQYMGQCQNIHVSTNCYYGYHDPKTLENSHVTTDCEMLEMPQADGMASASPKSNARKRSADDSEYPLSKRIREGKNFSFRLWNLIEYKFCSYGLLFYSVRFWSL